MTERRAQARHRTFIKGRIYFNNRLSSMDCIVRDVTDAGARLEFSDAVTLPEIFELHVPSKDENFQAQIKWRSGSQIGVAWTQGLAPSWIDSRSAEHPIADRLAKLEHEVALLRKRLDAMQDS